MTNTSIIAKIYQNPLTPLTELIYFVNVSLRVLLPPVSLPPPDDCEVYYGTPKHSVYLFSQHGSFTDRGKSVQASPQLYRRTVGWYCPLCSHTSDCGDARMGGRNLCHGTNSSPLPVASFLQHPAPQASRYPEYSR